MACPYTPEQIDCICESLYRAQDGRKLVRFFSSLPPELSLNSNSLSVIRARLYQLFHTGAFKELYEGLRSILFDPVFHEELQDLWFRAHYAEMEANRRNRKALGPVEKYRLRKKYPPPYTIWDGQETIYSFKENSRKMLLAYYKQNKYPCAEEKKSIAESTRLSLVQVSNWFKNRRQRDKTTTDEQQQQYSSIAVEVMDL